MALPVARRRYRALEGKNDLPTSTEIISRASRPATDIISFLNLVFDLDVHLFSDPFHAKSWPAPAGEGSTFAVRQFQLQFDDLGFNHEDKYDDGQQRRGGHVSKGSRITTKHITRDNSARHGQTRTIEEVLEPLLQEIRVLASPLLRHHSNIIDLFGVAWAKQSAFVSDMWPFLVLEYAAAGNLSDFMASVTTNLSWSGCLDISRDILSGLSALHSFGIIHADLKPENILVVLSDEGAPVVKLADFASCIIMNDYRGQAVTSSPAIHFGGGTPRWLAPEARSGQILLRHAQMLDVYAFGLVFATVVMRGQNPFTIETAELTDQTFHLLQDREELAKVAYTNIKQTITNSDELQIVAELLHSTLASSPLARKPVVQLGHIVGIELINSPVKDKTIITNDIMTWPISDAPEPTVSRLDAILFEINHDHLDQIRFMPLGVQKELIRVLKQEASGASPDEKLARTRIQKIEDILYSDEEPDDTPGVKAEDLLSSDEKSDHRLGLKIENLFSDRDVTEMQYLLAVLLLEGVGGKQDLEEGMKWLAASAEGGHYKAIMDLVSVCGAVRSDLDQVGLRLFQDILTQGRDPNLTKLSQDGFFWERLKLLNSILSLNILGVLETPNQPYLDPELSGMEWSIALSSACFEHYMDCHPSRASDMYFNIDYKLCIKNAMSQAKMNPKGFLFFLSSMSNDYPGNRLEKDRGSGLQWIHFLVTFGAIELLSMVVSQLKPDLQKADTDGRTPLYFAVVCRDSAMVDFLLANGASAAFTAGDITYNCLHLVGSFPCEQIPRMVQKLVEAGADINAQTVTGATPLHKVLMQQTSKSGNLATVEALLKYGADPCTLDNDGEPPHYWAVVSIQPESLRTLLKATKEIMDIDTFCSMKAVLFDYLITVPQYEVLLLSGARYPDCLDEIVSMLLDQSTLQAYKALPGNGGDNAILSVAGRGNLQLLQSMHRCLPFIDVNEGEGEYNRPALRYAIRHNNHGVFEALLDFGANLFYADSNDENALHTAAEYAPELLESILKISVRADRLREMLNAKSQRGLTPFDVAVIHGNLEIAQSLIDLGATYPEFRCISNGDSTTTTLGYILSLPSTTVRQVEFLLGLSDSPVVSEDGRNVFHALADINNEIQDQVTRFEDNSAALQIFDLLFRAFPSEIHTQDCNGRTPLHLANENTRPGLVNRLCEAGAALETKDHDGMTALDRVRFRSVVG